MSGWRKSSFSGNGGCVEINIGPVDVLVRDTKHRSDAFLAFTYAEWAAHIAAVQAGEHRLPGTPPPVMHAELHREIARLDAQRVEQWDRMNRQIYQLKAALRALVVDTQDEYSGEPSWRAALAVLSGHPAEAAADGHYAVRKTRGIAELVLLHPRSDCGNGCGGKARSACATCDDMGAVEFPESGPCPDCRTA